MNSFWAWTIIAISRIGGFFMVGFGIGGSLLIHPAMIILLLAGGFVMVIPEMMGDYLRRYTG